MPLKTNIKLSVMMFLEFAIWGVWFVTMGTYLTAIKFSGAQQGNAYSTTAIAAIISPFIIGLIVDRFFSAEKVLGIMHIIGGIALFYASKIVDPNLFFWILLLYTLCYMPTLALTSAIAFHQMNDPGKQFPIVRVFGTIGWILAGLYVGFQKLEPTATPMQIAAGLSIVMGIFSFFLPHTPPKSIGHKVTIRDILGLDALKLLKDRAYAIFIAASLLICIPLAFYYAAANRYLNAINVENAAGKMTLGQGSEVFFMLVIPFCFRRFGVKWMLLIGMLAWTARYYLFAFGNAGAGVWMLFGAILLHGVCYDFFFVTGQIYVDQKAPVALRAAAQGFITLITQGLGMLIGNQIFGALIDHYEGENGVVDWHSFWLFPMFMSLIVAILFFLTFKEKKQEDDQDVEEGIKA